MPKLNPNDKCHCSSDKKYKKCCMMKDMNAKNDEELKYLNGHDNSSEKIKFCMEHYKNFFDKHKIIDVTEYINCDNYKTFQIKNYQNKTLMLATRTEKNNELFLEKGDSDTYDFIIMYKGVYRIMNILDLFKYNDDIINVITKRDQGLSV